MSDDAGGILFTWGRGSKGQLGHGLRYPGSENCALPHPVRALPQQVVHVSCGGAHQGFTAAVAASGELFTWGQDIHGRLGHGPAVVGRMINRPLLVTALARRGEQVQLVACGGDHAIACTRIYGHVFSWGAHAHGALGRGAVGQGKPGAELSTPAPVLAPDGRGLLTGAFFVDAEHGYSAAIVLEREQLGGAESQPLHDRPSGQLYTWGANTHGRLGLGASAPATRLLPACVEALGAHVVHVSLGSLYAAACTRDGGCWTWGYGGHGNLGHGDRAPRSTPCRVGGAALEGVCVVAVACTRGQPGVKGGLISTQPRRRNSVGAAGPAGGAEGPHTMALSDNGELYTWGTCHKGVLANLGDKDGAFGRPWDELTPYRVGDSLRNGSSCPPMSPFACWPPPYSSAGPFIGIACGHIHAAAVDVEGRAWAWGCGSNDGRCGVERFLNAAGEGKPPRVDAMKCYLMGPHRVGVARPAYWPAGPSLRGWRVLQIACARNHMAAIAVPAHQVDAVSTTNEPPGRLQP